MAQEQKPRTIGAFLYQKRKEEGFSLREMANALGISTSLLSEIEGGKRFPSDPVLSKISKKFKVEIDELRNFDIRIHLQDLKHMVNEYPELGFSIQKAVQKINSGEASIQDLVAVLSSGKFSVVG